MKFNDFKSNFPDEDSCRAYLFNLKWGDGYRCSKCSYTKGSVDSDLRYKCNSCYYIESPTAKTLFSGTKMNIHVAFCLFYHVVYQPNSYSTAKLARDYNLSQTSVWLFCNKIKEGMIDAIMLYHK